MPIDVGAVVDKLAEKIGVAVEKLMPVAQEVIRQVRLVGVVEAVTGAAFLVMAVVCALLFKRVVTVAEATGREYTGSALVMSMALGTAAVLLFILGIVFVPDGLIQYVAPLPHLLGK